MFQVGSKVFVMDLPNGHIDEHVISCYYGGDFYGVEGQPSRYYAEELLAFTRQDAAKAMLAHYYSAYRDATKRVRELQRLMDLVSHSVDVCG